MKILIACLCLLNFSPSYAVYDPPKQEPISCLCGQENINGALKTRVVGGTEVWPPNRYPWLAVMTTSWGEVLCGAALINDRYLLTASHCLYGQKPKNIDIILGAHDMSTKDYISVKAEKFILHEDYEKSRQLNDIGLIKLKYQLKYTREIQPVCLPTVGDEKFDRLIVAGWGRIREGGALTSKPRQVVVPQLPESRCFSVFGQFMTSNNICAGGQRQQDACQGDFGGPLVSKMTNGSYVVAGVTSFGIGCGRAGFPGAYTKVTNYLDGIKTNSLDGQLCPETKQCGVSQGLSRRKRVVGGTATQLMEFPWVAAIAIYGQVRGVGVLINDRYVLTSAKNIKMIDPNGELTGAIRILLGANDITKRESTKKVFQVAKVHFHPLFGKSHLYSMDFALIELNKEAREFNPICLPSYDQVIYEEDPMTTAGWGRTSSTGSGSKKLLKATINLKSVTECSSSYLNNIEPNMLCASGQSSNACFGDEGGPLMMDVDGKSTLLGVKSWGSSYGCSLPDKPSVYADVRWALPWISSLTGTPFE